VIIEAGYDLHQIVDPYLRDRKHRQALWMILLDEELRYLRVRKVASIYAGSVEAHITGIAKKLIGEGLLLWPEYFALAHRLDLAHDGNIANTVYQDDLFVRDAPSLSDFSYLGRLVVDDEYAYQSWPRYSFRDYAGHHDLPRAASIPGPHPCGCDCVACSRYDERLAAARDRDSRAGALEVGGHLGD